MPRYCLTVDLINDPKLIAEYEQYHERIWPEIEASIKDSGIIGMEIYRYENRLFMIMETNNSFSFDAKAVADASNEKVQEWETLMWNYQQALPTAKKGEKWVIMKKIFHLNERS
jgi:L-rhamnose mutarotase